MINSLMTKSYLQVMVCLLLQYGLVGSTEWAEDFPEWITKNVVAYLNVGMLPFHDCLLIRIDKSDLCTGP